MSTGVIPVSAQPKTGIYCRMIEENGARTEPYPAPSGGPRSCFANRDDMGGYFAAARTAWAKAAWACQSSSFDATGQAELTAMTSFSAG